MPLSPFLSAESRSDREFQWQPASQGSETTNPGRCKSPPSGVGTGWADGVGVGGCGWRGGAQVVGNAPRLRGWGARAKDGKGPGCRTALGSACKDEPSARSLSITSPAMRPIDFKGFSLLFHLPHPSPVSPPGVLKSGRVGNQLQKCKGGHADGTAPGNCGVPSSFGSRSSLPWGLNSARHKRGWFPSQATISH